MSTLAARLRWQGRANCNYPGPKEGRYPHGLTRSRQHEADESRIVRKILSAATGRGSVNRFRVWTLTLDADNVIADEMGQTAHLELMIPMPFRVGTVSKFKLQRRTQ